MTQWTHRQSRRLVMVSCLLAGTTGLDGMADDWARFRGPNGSGVGESRSLPLEFDPATNVVWKTDLPVGYSSPIVSGDRIYLTGVLEERLLTIAVDRTSGRILWEREAPRDRSEPLDPRNHPAAPSVAVAGDRLFAFFGDYGLLAYDLDGREIWRQPLGPFNNFYGMGASPIVVGELVVLVCDQGTNSFIVAFEQASGRERWRTARPEAKSGHSTPVLWTPDGGDTQILVPGSFMLTAYDAGSGEKLWWVGGLCFEVKSTPVIDGDTLYINGFGAPENEVGASVALEETDALFAARDGDGDGEIAFGDLPDERAKGWAPAVDLDRDEHLSRAEWDYFRAALASRNGLLAIALGGRGDMTQTNVRWRYHRAVPQLPSPLLYENVLYMVNDGGIVTSLNPETGRLIAQGRLKGAIDRYYASPVAADGKVFMSSEKGKIVVLRPGGSLEPVAVNDLGDDVYATPALVGDRIYVRTRHTLYAFGYPTP